MKRSKTPPPRKESAEQAAIIRLLDSCGFLVWPTSEGRMVRRPAGLPDLYAFHPMTGDGVWIEVKRQKLGKVSPEQELFAAMHRPDPRYPPGRVPYGIVGGEAEVAAWLEHYRKPPPGSQINRPVFKGNTYHEWHRIRVQELAKRKAKKRWPWSWTARGITPRSRSAPRSAVSCTQRCPVLTEERVREIIEWRSGRPVAKGTYAPRNAEMVALATEVLALRQQVEDSNKHNCESWREEVFGCAECNPMAIETRESWKHDPVRRERDRLRQQNAALRAMVEEAITESFWSDHYGQQLIEVPKLRARLAALGEP